ncbi:VanZ family protein [Microbacterium sp.]|uniref:VanZ family protein n=1 Tax=Microbacterium sp. TaxID=51671 RepID=UPI00281174D3|nr:VanZ family protein [Microbacterium sp.]
MPDPDDWFSELFGDPEKRWVPESGPRAPEAPDGAQRRPEWGAGIEGPQPHRPAQDPLLFLPRFMLVPYAVVLLLLTWLPGEQASVATGIVNRIARFLAARDIVPYSLGYPMLEFLANIALFVPLGLLLAAGWPRLPWWSIAATGLATTVTIEAVQILIPSRYPSFSDLVANTLGGIIGWTVVAVVRTLAQWSRRTLEE